MALIRIENLTKSYGFVKAVKNISFDVEQGEAFALIGPNGAGKTSLVKSLLGLISYKGKITIDDVENKKSSARQSLAYLPEKFSFYNYYTVRGVFEFYGSMRNIDKAKLKEQVSIAANKVKIEDLLDRKISTLSKGQLQRLGLGTTLIGDNKIIILDEPFSGLDPIGIKDIKDLIAEFVNEGRTVFINSHILGEIEKICTRFAIINKGELLEIKKMSDIAGESLEDYFYKKVNG